jgi:hypothetical protein
LNYFQALHSSRVNKKCERKWMAAVSKASYILRLCISVFNVFYWVYVYVYVWFAQNVWMELNILLIIFQITDISNTKTMTFMYISVRSHMHENGICLDFLNTEVFWNWTVTTSSYYRHTTIPWEHGAHFKQDGSNINILSSVWWFWSLFVLLCNNVCTIKRTVAVS